MRINMTQERVRDLYTIHQRNPEYIIIVILEGKWFEMTFSDSRSWYVAGGVQKQAVEFTLRPLFK